MERVLLVGAAMVALGITLVAFWVLITFYGTTIEMVEDHVTGWLEGR